MKAVVVECLFRTDGWRSRSRSPSNASVTAIIAAFLKTGSGTERSQNVTGKVPNMADLAHGPISSL